MHSQKFQSLPRSVNCEVVAAALSHPGSHTEDQDWAWAGLLIGSLMVDLMCLFLRTKCWYKLVTEGRHKKTVLELVITVRAWRMECCL